MTQKNYVLDTNVLLHDPSTVYGFDDNTVVISPTVLEELDNLKEQNRSVSADARQVIRFLDSILKDVDPSVLSSTGVARNDEGGLLMIPSPQRSRQLLQEFSEGTNDQKIIRDALLLSNPQMESADNGDTAQPSQQQGGDPNRRTIFVSRDINARLIAMSAGLVAEDYQGAKVRDCNTSFPEGYIVDPTEGQLWNLVKTTDGHTHTFSKEQLEQVLESTPVFPRMGIGMEDGYLGVESVDGDHVVANFHPLKDSHQAWGVEPVDNAQAMGLEALFRDDIPLVMMTGKAGSGKTLLALASALQMRIDDQRFNKIIISRAAQGLDEDIGFLPGTEAEKVGPWLGGIQDNIEVLLRDAADMTSAVEQVERYIQYRSINYMRGRSIQDGIFLIDEAQNLTPHQLKTLVTRVGNGTKIVVLGDLSQIDNPFLSEFSSGLTYLIQNMRGSTFASHINLKGSPRSELAEDAAARL